MEPRRITRRQAIISLATLTMGVAIKPSSIFCSPVKDKIRFGVIGDWGTGDRDQVGVAKQIYTAHQRTPFDMVICAGDNIYPNGSGRHFAHNFEQPFAKLLQDKVPFYAVLGNHDVEAGRDDQCRYSLFNMGNRNYYQFTTGDGLAEFFMLDSTDFDTAQTGWVENALRASTAKWKFAVLHHPLYSSGKHGSAVGLRKTLEPLFTRYGVNVAISGHDHIYERTKPQQGIQYFVSGAAGKVRRGDIDKKTGLSAASFDADNHFMIFEIDSNSVGFQAISETGLIVDNGVVAT